MQDVYEINSIVRARDREYVMIDLTRLNDMGFTVNADLIELIEEVPDTVITLINGKKLFVKESRQMVISLVKLYKKEVFCRIINNSDE